MFVEELVVSKNQCFGCFACEAGCPAKAISMKNDNEGFYIPSINPKLCARCGKCINICPALQFNALKHVSISHECYIAQSRDKRRKKSASGGIFLTIADYVIRNGGIVFGAAFDKDNVVKHIGVETVKKLTRLQNSKYVQSGTCGIYRDVSKNIKTGRKVLFSGTPCQVAGLYASIGRKYENLLTIDIICHGVPSPKLLSRQLAEESKSWQGKVKRVSFRYKNPAFETSSSFYMMMMMMMRGLPIVRRPQDDPYFNIFSKGYGFRETCYSCPFASPNRVGDLTLGDCDSHRLYPDFHPSESNSTVLLNTNKARNLWNSVISRLCDARPLNLSEEIKCNKQLGHPSERPEQRDSVYKDLDSLDWKLFSRKYALKQTMWGKLRAYGALMMPSFVVKLWSKMHR